VAFLEKRQTVSIWFYKLAEFHPKHCILADETATHTVRVCVSHQNRIFVLQEAHLTAGLNAKKKKNLKNGMLSRK
jgi:hypothetical protein